MDGHQYTPKGIHSLMTRILYNRFVILGNMIVVSSWIHTPL